MITGVECAGLILAVIPIFVQMGKAYLDGVDNTLNVFQQHRWDESLEEFYESFYIQINILNETLKTISEATAERLVTQQHTTPSIILLSNWQLDPQLEAKLRRYFGSGSRFNHFTVAARKIIELLAKLAENPGNRLDTADQNSQAMFRRLRELALARSNGATPTSLRERFNFFRLRKKREKCIEKLRTWNGELQDLTGRVERDNSHRACGASAHIRSPIRGLRMPVAPPMQFRSLIANLYNAFSNHCRCNCPIAHQVQLCLKESIESATADPELKIGFFVSARPTSGSLQPVRWQEGQVQVLLGSQTGQGQQEYLQRICEALERDLHGFRLCLVVENVNGNHTIRNMQPTPRQLLFSDELGPISLRDLLTGSTKMSPVEKRGLALVFSYSLLLFHDSGWLDRGWLKDNIFFFHKSEDEPDLEYPFLSTNFSNILTTDGQSMGILFHRNPNIFTLGVILIEIFNEKPIEGWRTAQDRSFSGPNTDTIVADRIVKKMDQTPAREAIEACLSMDWVDQNHSAELNDPDVRDGFLRYVIAPLEQEMTWLSRT